MWFPYLSQCPAAFVLTQMSVVSCDGIDEKSLTSVAADRRQYRSAQSNTFMSDSSVDAIGAWLRAVFDE